MQWRTINKYLGTYSGLFGWAEENGRVGRSPFTGLALKAPRAVSEPPRRPFSLTELRQIRLIVLADVGLELDKKWVTLLAMYSGARQNEICQLLVSDVVEHDGMLCIEISTKGEGQNKKQLKNSGSTRTIPVHSEILAAGFAEYVAKVRTNNTGRLFPQLTYREGMGYGRRVGQWFNGPLLRRIGLDGDARATFHSLRHSVTMLLRAAEVPEPRISAILGHEQATTTTAVYGGKFPLVQLKADIEHISI